MVRIERLAFVAATNDEAKQVAPTINTQVNRGRAPQPPRTLQRVVCFDAGIKPLLTRALRASDGRPAQPQWLVAGLARGAHDRSPLEIRRKSRRRVETHCAPSLSASTCPSSRRRNAFLVFVLSTFAIAAAPHTGRSASSSVFAIFGIILFSRARRFVSRQKKSPAQRPGLSKKFVLVV
jgi:hypothetical protein